MRASLALIVLGAAGPVLGAAGLATAAALPPPPYAADPQYQAAPQYGAPQYGAPAYGVPQNNRQQGYPGAYRPAQSNDRYSGGGAHPVAAPAPQQYAFGQPAAQAAPAAGRTLGWSGKVEATPLMARQQPQGGWSQMTDRWNAPAPQPVAQQAPQGAYPAYRPAQPAGDQGWRPLYPNGAPAQNNAPAPVQAAPRTIYDAPQQPPAPQRQANAQYGAQNPVGPHFYSLHREYGISPDPIPIPPRFFGPTADLSAPPPDPVLKRVTDANGQTHTQAVPTDDQGS